MKEIVGGNELEERDAVQSGVLDDKPTDTPVRSVPLAVRRLRRYNLPGLKELEESPPKTRLRVRQ